MPGVATLWFLAAIRSPTGPARWAIDGFLVSASAPCTGVASKDKQGVKAAKARYIVTGKKAVLGKGMAKILLVDDDVRLSEVIDDWLTAESHVVEYQSDGRGGWEKMTTSEYDVIILDWNLPDTSGPDLCR